VVGEQFSAYRATLPDDIDALRPPAEKFTLVLTLL
jgi:hypothetical protein